MRSSPFELEDWTDEEAIGGSSTSEDVSPPNLHDSPDNPLRLYLLSHRSRLCLLLFLQQLNLLLPQPRRTRLGRPRRWGRTEDLDRCGIKVASSGIGGERESVTDEEEFA